MKLGQLAVTRFAIQCCAADSTPYGVLADMDPSHPLKKDEWVRHSTTGQVRRERGYGAQDRSIKED